MPNPKIQIILKKTAFSLILFIFESFVPILAGIEMAAGMIINYGIAVFLYLLGFKNFPESGSPVIFAVTGALFAVLLHLLYHILIDGIFETGLLIEMNIELFAVFLFFSLPDSILENIIRDYKSQRDILPFMTSSKYLFLAAAVLYAMALTVFFTLKHMKKKKSAGKNKK